MKKTILFSALAIQTTFSYCQSTVRSEIVIAKNPKINEKCSVLNVRSSDKTAGGFLINYVLIVKAAVGADNEMEMNGGILKNNQVGNLKYIPNSDKVLVYLSQEIDSTGKEISLKVFPMALRDFEKAVEYRIKSCEENIFLRFKDKIDLNLELFFTGNNIPQTDKYILEQYLQPKFKGETNAPPPQPTVAESFKSLGNAFSNLSAVPFKKGEVPRSETKLNGLYVFVMFDKSSKKSEGSIHRIYFTTDKKELTLVDSIVSQDEYKFLETKKVFSPAGSITGVLSTFVVEKKLEGKETEKSLCAVYTDLNKTVKKWSFKTGDNKWNSFKAHIYINYGDSILAISDRTTGLMSFHREVHLFYSNGEVKKTYPLTEISSDDKLVQYISSGTSQGVSLGSDCELLADIKKGDFHYIVVQGKEMEGWYIKNPKSTSTITSQTKNYTIPVVYQLKNNSIINIYNVTNEYFEPAPFKMDKICNGTSMIAYWLNYPKSDDAILKVDNKGVTLIPESKDGWAIQKMLNNDYVILTTDHFFYLLYKNIVTQNFKLVKFY